MANRKQDGYFDKCDSLKNKRCCDKIYEIMIRRIKRWTVTKKSLLNLWLKAKF